MYRAANKKLTKAINVTKNNWIEEQTGKIKINLC